MPIHVELYGVPRQRVGVANVQFDSPGEALTLGELLNRLADRFPALKEDCIADGQMKPGYVANLNGDRFLSDPSFLIKSGQCLLIMSADAGG